MWGGIGYDPQDVEIASLYDDHGDHEEDHLGAASQQSGGKFTPTKSQSFAAKFGGIVIKNFPKDSDDAAILNFFLEHGLPRDL